MANHFRLYGRPLMADEVLPPLTVTGSLPFFVPGEPYEGRLHINNSIGRCTVEVIEANLPPGYSVRVDNVTKQVVVKWAAFTEVLGEETLVPNGDFEAGDDGTWLPGGGSNGEGWSIGTGPDYDTDSGVYSARFANIKTGGSDLLNPLIPAKVNDYIRCTAEVQQGASSKGKAGARVSIIYRKEDGTELQRNSGNRVSSGSNGAWHQSVAEGAAPEGTKYVQVVLSAFRSKQNKPLWVDTVKWNHKYVLGTNTREDYFLKIKVTDSANRVAYWEGTLLFDSFFVTSRPYLASAGEDGIVSNAGEFGASLKTEVQSAEPVSSEWGSSEVSLLGTLRSAIIMPPAISEEYTSAPTFTGTLRAQVLVAEPVSSARTDTADISATLKRVVILAETISEKYTSAPTFTGTLTNA